MSFNKLKEFIQLAKEEGVGELKYEGKEGKYSVSFAQSAAPMAQFVGSQMSALSSPAAGSASTVNASNDHHIITSPFVGTFYTSPEPNSPAFVKVGERVSKGQTLCILEAMKIMNEIEADVSGELVEICLENESLVEFGQPLFKIKR